MDKVTMLQVLNEHGAEAGSNSNDGDEVMGFHTVVEQVYREIMGEAA